MTHFDAEHKLAGVLADFVKELADKPLLLHELDVAEHVCCELNGLVETILTPCRYVHQTQGVSVAWLVKKFAAKYADGGCTYACR